MPEPWNQDVRGTQVLPLINLDAETIRVESGPGTGKTFGLVRRVERILHSGGLNVSGKDVLIVAFNRVIAKQLRSEIEKRINSSKERPGPTVRTIHGLCVQLVGEDVRLLLPHEREAMLYDVLHAFPVLRKRYKKHKRADIALLEHEARNADHHELWQAVNLWLGRHKARLVSDLPGLVLDKMKGGDLADERYLHVIVEEFQDLTPGEQALVFGLRVEGGQLVALGDPRQSIYRFRGNDPEGLDKLDELAEEWGNGAVVDVVMTEWQRCPAPIVRAANRLMSLSPAAPHPRSPLHS
jgi:superfamily I DNA/RNA helicase